MGKLEIFYDVTSPFSFFGFEIACRLRDTWKIDLVFRPFFLAGVMKHCSNTSPALHCKQKGVYLGKEIDLLAEYYKVPLHVDMAHFSKVAFQKTTLKTMRFVTAVQLSIPEFVEELSRQLWVSFFQKQLDISEPDVIREAAERAGMNKEQIEKAMKETENDNIKKQLFNTTEEAIKSGAFGAPWFFVHGKDGKKYELFGSDRYELMAKLLGEEYPGPLPHLSKF